MHAVVWLVCTSALWHTPSVLATPSGAAPTCSQGNMAEIGRRHLAEGDLSAAKAALNCLRLQKANSWSVAGLLLDAEVSTYQGRYRHAISRLNVAQSADPANADVQWQLGTLYNYYRGSLDWINERAALEFAAYHYDKYLKLRPGSAGIYNDYGLVLSYLGQEKKAISSWERGVRVDPLLYSARTNLGLQLMKSTATQRQGVVQLREAVRAAEQLAKAGVQSARTHLPALLNNLGSALVGQETLAHEALPVFERAVELDPELAQALESIGNIKAGKSMVDEARLWYARAAASAARSGDIELSNSIRIKSAHLLPRIYRSSEEMMEWRWRHMASLTDMLATARSGNLNVSDPSAATLDMGYYLVYMGLDNRRPRELLASVFLTACPSLSGTLDQALPPAPRGGRKRIGFVSEYFHEHSTTKLFGTVIADLALSSEIHVTLFMPASMRQDRYTEWLKTAAQKVVLLPDVRGNLGLARSLVRQEYLDLLVYVEIGMGMLSYFLAFARLARHSAMLWGHGVTSGIPNVDYFITSKWFHPPANAAESGWSENMHLMPGLTTAFLDPPIPVTLPSFDLRSACHIATGNPNYYLAPTSLYKWHPAMDEPLGELLIHDPNGVLVVVAGMTAGWAEVVAGRFRESLARKHGAEGERAGERLIVIPSMPRNKYLSFMRKGDVVALPFPTTSGTTAFESIAVGTPFVTLKASAHYLLQHYSSGFLRRMNVSLECCVARNRQEYTSKLLRLGTDAEYRARVSQSFKIGSRLIFGPKARAEVLQDWKEFIERLT